MKSVHDGIFYAYDYCDYKANVKASLKTQIEMIHKNVFYT